VGLLDTAGRAFLPFLFRKMFPAVIAAEAGPAVASMLIYMLMAAVLYFRPSGLFPARG
jgi:branched-chain amino acid transport system permease protein